MQLPSGGLGLVTGNLPRNKLHNGARTGTDISIGRRTLLKRLDQKTVQQVARAGSTGVLSKHHPRGGKSRIPGQHTNGKLNGKLNGMSALLQAVKTKDPVQSVKAVGLRYVTDSQPGFSRVRKGKTFVYLDEKGKKIRDPDILARIKSLVIPPAWTNVWICPLANGHLQATGRDAKGRKQHRYHPRWKELRDATKFDRIIAFGKALPKIRRRVEADLQRPGLPREKVLAAVVKLLETSLIRVGNEEYAKQNESFGLTTMRDRHVDIDGSRLRFAFKGKSGVRHCVDLQDRRLAKIVRSCQELPGHELFQYVNEEGEHCTIDSADVNEYLRDIGGREFTSKDFRTWAGTVLAARALQEFQTFDSQAQAKRQVVNAIESVAKRLGNTKSVCRQCYIHPAIIDSYMDRSLLETVKARATTEIQKSLRNMQPEEAAVLAFLQQRLKRESGDA